MAKKRSHPAPVQRFLDNKSAYEKKTPLEIGSFIKLTCFEISDEMTVPRYDGPDESSEPLTDYVAYADDAERRRFKSHFIPLVRESVDDSMSMIIFGVFRDEEDRGFPVYYFGDLTESGLETISDTLADFEATYFAGQKKDGPQAALEKTLASVEALHRAKKHARIVESVDAFFDKYADFVKHLHKLDIDSKRMVGALYNFRGLAYEKLGDAKAAIAAFEAGARYGDESAYRNLAERRPRKPAKRARR